MISPEYHSEDQESKDEETDQARAPHHAAGHLVHHGFLSVLSEPVSEW